jgi:hypothetical protein
MGDCKIKKKSHLAVFSFFCQKKNGFCTGIDPTSLNKIDCENRENIVYDL